MSTSREPSNEKATETQKRKYSSVASTKEVSAGDSINLDCNNGDFGAHYGIRDEDILRFEHDEGDGKGGNGEEGVKPKKKKEITSRSEHWEHFDKFICDSEKVQKARCKYCKVEIRADPKKHGTKPLKNHYMSCKKKPCDIPSSQPRVSIQFTRGGDKDASLVNWRYNEEKTREALCAMLIIDELPFKTVENSGFRYFMSVACPMFKIPSRRTITRDIYNLYLNEKGKLRSFIKGQAQRVCLTTDTWTSLQKVNYMCLTAHFIDDDWILQKKILDFCPILGHKSEEIAKGVENCLLGWGIQNIFTITVDNASSNDGAIEYLQKKFDNWGTNLLDGKYIHMRCIAHIINLIVQDGLKFRNEHLAICRIRGAIRYIKNSPARYKRFKERVEYAQIESKKLLCLDVPTRWNSTYLMLDAAISLKKAFDAYYIMDFSYAMDLEKPPYHGVPEDVDWKRAEQMLKFLEYFYRLTLRISGSKYVTSNVMFNEISGMELFLKQWVNSGDSEFQDMAKKMKEKFDKYWGSFDKLNMILYYAVILDPRRKMVFLEFSFKKLYDNDDVKVGIVKETVRMGMVELFEAYELKYGALHCSMSTSSSSNPTASSSGAQYGGSGCWENSLEDEFEKSQIGENTELMKSELEKYLSEGRETSHDKFDILSWWKVNSHRFPILSKMTRDILAVPISTVASESAFSTGGRVLDAFRSSLSPRIVESLICTQDWLRMSPKPIDVEENLKEIEAIEEELTNLGIDSRTADV